MRAAAPLAQLRPVDQVTWRMLYAPAAIENPRVAPGRSALVQALAAALLGDTDLARTVLRDGLVDRTWPDLAPKETA